MHSRKFTKFNNYVISENSSLHGDFLNKYPGPATSSSTLDLQQKSLLEEQQKRLDTFQDTAHNSDKENLKSSGNKAVSTDVEKDIEFHRSQSHTTHIQVFSPRLLQNDWD